jgi:hypothetical protein
VCNVFTAKLHSISALINLLPLMIDSSPSVGEDDKYDLVIEGTGLAESILAAAASWAGKKVLHVDKNDFYGSHWAALSLNQIDTWVQDNAGSGIVTSYLR